MKNSKQLCRQVSKDLGIPEKEVQEVLTPLMLGMKAFIIGIRGPSITINRVGSFVAQMIRLNKILRETIKKVRHYRKPSKNSRMSDAVRKDFLANYETMLRRQWAVHNELAKHTVELKRYYAEKYKRKHAKMALEASNGTSPPEEGKPLNSSLGLVDQAGGQGITQPVSLDSQKKRVM